MLMSNDVYKYVPVEQLGNNSSNHRNVADPCVLQYGKKGSGASHLIQSTRIQAIRSKFFVAFEVNYQKDAWIYPK